MTAPKISTVTLTHNRADTLRQCIERIMMYSDHLGEIIVVDSGSTDWTLEMLEEFFPEVIVVKLGENLGGWGRNFGFEKAQYEFIGQIDSDVLVGPHWDSILLKSFSDSSVGLTGPQGWLMQGWERPNEGKAGRAGDYVDFLTGYIWLQRNIPEFRYPDGFGFWHEDWAFSAVVKELGWKIKQSATCANHLCLRGEVDWDAHEKGLDRVRELFMSSDNLTFEQFDQKAFLKNSIERI